MNAMMLGLAWRQILMRIGQKGPFPYEEIVADSLNAAACVDLGAFRKPLQIINGIDTLVIMADRSPQFFLSFPEYQSAQIVPLNRHGPLTEYTTQEDLRLLVQGLHDQGKKVMIGFWGFWGDGAQGPGDWMRSHPELGPRQEDESDIGDPFVTLRMEGITFADYIAQQHEKISKTFGFDGLFLGDGLSGYRDFLHPERYRNREDSCQRWAEFYRTIAKTVHRTNGRLWAYDCMGFSYEEARQHGADYRLLATAGLDTLVFQSYPTAWAYYFKVAGKTGLDQDLVNFKSVRTATTDTNLEVYYSLELGDSIEGWWPKHKTTRNQMAGFATVADGKFLVWGNDLIAAMK
jgi:hypothetical protein